MRGGRNVPEVIDEAIRTARKEHTCDYCGLKINIGEKYEDQTNIYDERLYHWKSHLSCGELTKELKMFDDCWYDEGLTADNFHEYVREYLHSHGIEYSGWADGLTKAKEKALKKVTA